MIIIDENRG